MSTDNRDPFALARQGGADTELLALIAEYRKREAYACEAGIDDDERARRCALSDEVLDQINQIRPTTLAGVLAVLDLGGEIEDPHHWPDEAVEGLREIAACKGTPKADADAELFAAAREYAELQPRWTPLANVRFDDPAVEALN